MVTRQKILVTGANGQLGKELNQLSSAYGQFEFIFLNKEQLPVHELVAVQEAFKFHRPQFCINCAAYTGVDAAETDKELAFKVNGEAPGILATVCKKHDTRFIHISTDYVFDGKATTPYKENAPVNPQGVYGASKLEGEKLVMKFNPDSIIIRTSWVYSQFGKNFVKTMLKLMKEKEVINVVNDQFGSPTHAADLAEAILRITGNGEWGMGYRHAGIYHYCNDGITNWYTFAMAIKGLTDTPCKINPISTAQYPTPAKRPAYSALDTAKIRRTFGIEVKDWKKSLADCLKQISISVND
jgi:dTDP-4-dehydrorhamnose reductase